MNLAQRIEVELDAGFACRICGCTDNDCSSCIKRTGEPCYWVEPDLCSACVEAAELQELDERIAVLEQAKEAISS